MPPAARTTALGAKRVSGKRGDAQDVDPAGVGMQLDAGKIGVDERSHVGGVEQTADEHRTEIRFRTVLVGDVLEIRAVELGRRRDAIAPDAEIEARLG
jgi:hypothetical protein